jgi:hypothetical protein
MFMTVATPVFGCSSHGSVAANNVNAWMNSQGLNAAGFSVTGDQEVNGSGAGEASGWAANDIYWVTVTAPNGESMTFEAVPTSSGVFGDGGSLEDWLEDAAKDWLIDNVPDQKLADFVG